MGIVRGAGILRKSLRGGRFGRRAVGISGGMRWPILGP